ncbi:MAG TPA: hypothetical protein VL096_06150 [Pirellulaceae bacterium]|nr:hypothetical protein [Pirellulaceae bacterium]
MSRTGQARRASCYRRWALRVGMLAATAAVGGFALLPRTSTGADYTVTHIVDNNSAGSLRSANAAGGGTPFEIDLALTPSDVITLGNKLEQINVDIIINGHGATIDGVGSHQIFFVAADNVTIKNFTLTEGNSIGPTQVDAGRLAINGSVTSNVTINNGGTGNYDAQTNANQVFHVGSAHVQYVW